MNRWLRVFCIFWGIFLANGTVFAQVCDSEARAVIDVERMNWPGRIDSNLLTWEAHIKNMQQGKPFNAENAGNWGAGATIESVIRYTEAELAEVKYEKNPYFHVVRKYFLCRLKVQLSAGAGSNRASNTASQQNQASQQQPQPTYKPGTSTLDRYLTAPKEDCDAIPQSYNVSDRQFSVSQCRLRNANRDKYAANANAASAQPATNVQSAQQKAQQAQLQAQQSQARADQARLGKRKTHDPAAEAHQCIDVDVDAPIVGGFRNKCGYAVSYGYCVFNPKKGGWTDSPIFNCNAMIGKTTAGGQDIKANGYDVNHTRGGESVYFFACKQPASAMDLTFISGQGIQGRCGNLMGN